jgi:ABC-type uncharacterized transport system ATPase component
MIVAKNLRFNELGDTLFEKVNLVIRDGERVGVMGSSEHIVTTFLQVMSSDTELDEGTVTAAGEKVAYVSAEKFSENTASFESLLGTRPTFIILDAQAVAPEISPAIMKCIRGFRGGMLIASNAASIMSVAKITRMLEVHAPTKSVMSFTQRQNICNEKF